MERKRKKGEGKERKGRERGGQGKEEAGKRRGNEAEGRR